mmetsp:Transcript_62865/g.142079  ORF Transcript_62865/g.142079 Transcript_62865/m.142079 type:complete len:404 (-) Transcript_62865:222-1433(-)
MGRPEEGAEQVVCLVAHLRHPSAQRVADQQRGEEAVPHLAESDEHHERNDRLREDQEEVKLAGCSRRLPGLHWLPVGPRDAVPRFLWHWLSTKCRLISLAGVLGAPCEQLLVLFFLLLSRILPLPLPYSSRQILVRSFCRQDLSWGLLCRGGVGRRLGFSSRKLHLRSKFGDDLLQEDCEAHEGESDEAIHCGERPDDDGRHERKGAADDAHPPEPAAKLLDHPEDEGEPEALEHGLDEASLEGHHVHCRVPQEGLVVVDAKTGQHVPDLLDALDDSHLQLTLVALGLLFAPQDLGELVLGDRSSVEDDLATASFSRRWLPLQATSETIGVRAHGQGPERLLDIGHAHRALRSKNRAGRVIVHELELGEQEDATQEADPPRQGPHLEKVDDPILTCRSLGLLL